MWVDVVVKINWRSLPHTSYPERNTNENKTSHINCAHTRLLLHTQTPTQAHRHTLKFTLILFLTVVSPKGVEGAEVVRACVHACGSKEGQEEKMNGYLLLFANKFSCNLSRWSSSTSPKYVATLRVMDSTYASNFPKSSERPTNWSNVPTYMRKHMKIEWNQMRKLFSKNSEFRAICKEKCEICDLFEFVELSE